MNSSPAFTAGGAAGGAAGRFLPFVCAYTHIDKSGSSWASDTDEDDERNADVRLQART